MADQEKLFNGDEIRRIRQEKERWYRETVKGNDGGNDYVTDSGIPVNLIYGPDDIADFDYLKESGFSGEPPYVRGVYPNMYRGRLFTIRQIAGFGTPEDTNRRFKFLLENGATGTSVVLDLPTIRGYDSDDPKAEGHVGAAGVAIDSLEDMEALYDGIPIDQVSSNIVTHLPSTTVVLMAMFVAMAEKRGLPLEKLSGTNQNDFLMETTIGSSLEILPPKASFRLQCDSIEYASKRLPRWNPVSYNGYNLREAGTTAVQEVGCAIANAIATTEELIRRGNDVDDFAKRLSFFWNLFNDFFEEIAKCRASRLVWYDVMKNRFGAKNPRSYLMRFHVQTGGITLTKVEPLNNIARSAIQGLAAVLGGAQSLHIDSYDEAYSAPTEQAALVSLRTQQIIQVETGVVNTVDPLAGSYYVEYLTREMAEHIRAYIDQIESRGGIIAVVESGWLHREIAEFAYRTQQDIETGKRKVVGLNYFPSKEAETKVEVFRYPEDAERMQKEKLAKLRARRDPVKVEQTLRVLREKCHEDVNILPYVKDAVEAYCTLGEIQNVFREEFGLWQFPLV
ncbi:acyl-CoA mutase large subunit family protein [Kyrpidia tusciae]|uniref:Methylmalonyl-CoA mutase, large subunit n=1 Tax=Kyrpidia tusciae (strain DSM 2912 / NBRC 15312 / T2) TaxID=562970 RepID=D5WTR7_KYRT2|nr:methylmalonyl-CoA mutase family protein [Kyrpidia tusciae]ADG05237.1 methylmalonyl-CoA mutase, large subunit [Kyrpidia tusciae DSM 2912]